MKQKTAPDSAVSCSIIERRLDLTLQIENRQKNQDGVKLVTGATGFIGKRLVNALRSEGAVVRALIRDPQKIDALWLNGSVTSIMANLTDASDLEIACSGVETVFHLASYAHSTDQDNTREGRLHWETTVEGTRAVLSAAQAAGVRRFVFLSSVKVMGEGGGVCLDETAREVPTTHYGRAKLVAERLVLAAGREHGIHVAVLRLPLVYGPGNKGNIPRMIAAIDRGRFPPWPNVQNRRSMVHVDDVVLALLLAAEAPVASGQIYLVTDGCTYSTRELYEAICRTLDRLVPPWSVPVWGLWVAARLGDGLHKVFGRNVPLTTDTLGKLLGSAYYSNKKICAELGFEPRYSIYEALPEMVYKYRMAPASSAILQNRD